MTASRYLNLPYIWHSLGLKSRAWKSSIFNTGNPYDTYRLRVEKLESNIKDFKSVDAYLSLTYFNYQEAIKVLKPGLIQDIMKALIYYNGFLKSPDFEKDDFILMVDKIIEEGVLEDDRLRFLFTESYDRFHLKGTYVSGIVQAKAASLLLRAYKVTNDDYYLRQAEYTLICLLDPIENLGTIRPIQNAMIWSEEYPSPTPSMVLNGHIFVLIALAEFLAIQEHEYIEKYYHELHCSTISYLPFFKCKNEVLYSMFRWNRSNINYLGVHAFQFHHLYKLTSSDIYKDWALFTRKQCKWKLFASILGIDYKNLLQRIPS